MVVLYFFKLFFFAEFKRFLIMVAENLISKLDRLSLIRYFLVSFSCLGRYC